MLVGISKGESENQLKGFIQCGIFCFWKSHFSQFCMRRHFSTQCFTVLGSAGTLSTELVSTLHWTDAIKAEGGSTLWQSSLKLFMTFSMEYWTMKILVSLLPASITVLSSSVHGFFLSLPLLNNFGPAVYLLWKNIEYLGKKPHLQGVRAAQAKRLQPWPRNILFHWIPSSTAAVKAVIEQLRWMPGNQPGWAHNSTVKPLLKGRRKLCCIFAGEVQRRGLHDLLCGDSPQKKTVRISSRKSPTS